MAKAGNSSSGSAPSRRSQIKARKRKLMAMTEEDRAAFLAQEAVDIEEVKLVKRSIGRQQSVIASSPKQEDL
jgi:hypothetical protein